MRYISVVQGMGIPAYLGIRSYGDFDALCVLKFTDDNGSTLPCYEIYLRNRLESDKEFRCAFQNLKDKPNPYHGDVMIEVLKEEPKQYELHVCGFKDMPEGKVIANTTSRSNDFGRIFSPFLNQGPIEMYNLQSHNVENFWQYTKVYSDHVDDPKAWIAWRNTGLSSTKPERYPMGKGTKAEFSYIKQLGRLPYIEARKQIYVPIYRQKLERYCQRGINTLLDMLSVTDVWLLDFDGRQTTETFDEVLNNPEKSLGHAFIIQQYIKELR